MIERKFVREKLKEFQIQEYMNKALSGVGQSHTTIQKTPLGEKIVIYASRPGLVVGRGGANIRKLTKDLKEIFGLENPQIEISEIDNINMDANIVAERIANSLEKFGSAKFKGVGHKTMEQVMLAGALGVEILISGKIPGSRAKRWRFYQGYLKKCGEVALTGINTSYKVANLKKGTIGIQVRIMPPNIELPDKIIFVSELEKVEEVTDLKPEDEPKKDEPKNDKDSKDDIKEESNDKENEQMEKKPKKKSVKKKKTESKSKVSKKETQETKDQEDNTKDNKEPTDSN
jgi:small subunit ribosomal protein S3